MQAAAHAPKDPLCEIRCQEQGEEGEGSGQTRELKGVDGTINSFRGNFAYHQPWMEIRCPVPAKLGTELKHAQPWQPIRRSLANEGWKLY